MLELTVRIAFSLLVVLGIMWGVARVMRRPLASRSAGSPLAVISRQQLSRGASVAVVRVGEQALVVGVTEQRITLLTEAPLAAVEAKQVEHREPVTLDELALAGNGRAANGRGAHALSGTGLSGSALSLSTWRQAATALRTRGIKA
jgi:flagellar protein FliO/FliZ